MAFGVENKVWPHMDPRPPLRPELGLGLERDPKLWTFNRCS